MSVNRISSFIIHGLMCRNLMDDDKSISDPHRFTNGQNFRRHQSPPFVGFDPTPYSREKARDPFNHKIF